MNPQVLLPIFNYDYNNILKHLPQNPIINLQVQIEDNHLFSFYPHLNHKLLVLFVHLQSKINLYFNSFKLLFL